MPWSGHEHGQSDVQRRRRADVRRLLPEELLLRAARVILRPTTRMM